MGDEIRGITRRDERVWALFRDLARGDFRHDFDERVAARDLITSADEQRFFDIAKRVSTKGSVWLRTNFKSYVNKTIFDVLSPSIDAILPPLTPPPSAVDPAFYKETDLLLKVGVDFEAIKKAVTTAPPGAGALAIFKIPGVGDRSYTLRSSPYRLGPKGAPGYSQNRNITQMFREATGGKQKFALIVDASGGLPLTELLNTSLEPYAPGGEFFIIENIENTGDSATKINKIKPTVKPGTTPPNLRFLKDTEKTVVYPLWSVLNDPKSNVYSSLKIVLNRISDDEVEANIAIVDPAGNTLRSFEIGDLSSSSNVKNASLYALAVFLEQGLVEEAFVYTLIKRMGDWCQALSLLDLDRVYDILDEARDATDESTTLRDMLVDTEIGIVTNDRILLAFSILLGLNVFFTTAMDTSRLIYFKNNNDVPAGPALEARSAQIYAQSKVDEEKIKQYEAFQSAAIADIRAKVQSEKDITMYIYKLKCALSNLGKMRQTLEPLQAQYDEMDTVYATTKGIERFNAANAMASIRAKIELDIEYNTRTLADFAKGIYPGSQADMIRLQSLQRKLAAGGRITKSVEVVEAKEIVFGIRDDAYQILDKDIMLESELESLFRTNFMASNERTQTNYNEIIAAIQVVKTAVQTTQTGGGVDKIPSVFNLIRARTIRVLPPGSNEATSNVNIYIRGGKYIDEKLKAYTVVDECIVTEDDYSAFDGMFEGITVKNPPPSDIRALYICLKYLILRCDMLENRLESLRQTTDGIDGAFEVGTVASQTHLEIKNRLLQLEAATKDPWGGAIAIYDSGTDTTPVPGTIDDTFNRIQAARMKFIQMFDNAKIQVMSNPAELGETNAIEDRVRYASVRVGYYREAIAQKIFPFITPVTTSEEKAEIGNAIENVLNAAILLPITGNQDVTDPRPQIVANADGVEAAITAGIKGWLTAKRKDMKQENLLAYVKTIATTIRNEEMAKKGGLRERRPLYSNVHNTRTHGPRSDRDARLRRRTRTRRTSRIRKQSRRTKTR